MSHRDSLRGSRPIFAVLLFVTASLALAGAQTEAPKPTPTPPAEEKPTAAPPPASRPTAKQRAKEIKDITGTIETDKGTVRFKLEPNKCPLLCANFCNLVRRGFFDGRPFRDFTRVVRQAGTDTVWYTLPREFDPSLLFDRGGRIAMSKDVEDPARAKAHGTRFFITIKEQERWNLDYPIFGNVTSGLEALVALEEGDQIRRITVEGDVEALLREFAPEVARWNAASDEASEGGRR